MKSENREFAGRAVKGDIYDSFEDRGEQATPEEIIKKFDELFENKAVVAVRWSQYTPYFNDGDVCTFGINCPMVYYKVDNKLYGYGDWGFFHAEDSMNIRDCDQNIPGAWEVQELHPAFAIGKELEKKAQFIQTRANYEAFQKIFGDHAKITYDGKQFTIEEYQHD